MNLDKIENSVLIKEIEKRFEQRDHTIYELQVVMKKMEEMNKKLLNAEDNRSKFISIIRNEFNNPLASMLTLSKKLVSKKENIDIELIGNNIYKDVLNLNFQIANIINVAEIEAGTLQKEISLVNFDDVIDDIKDALQYIISEKNIKLDITTSLDDEPIYQDQSKIYAILVNLVSNAVNFSPKDSTVELDITQDEDYVRFIVKDYGEGISQENRKIIFERFRQAHSGMNRTHMGQGLGMGVIRDFIEFLKGEYELESTVNKSTTFKFCLPKETDEENMFMDDDLFFDEGEEF
ncbi:MAG: sensor histidine kinase [Campylobacterota bacterium]